MKLGTRGSDLALWQARLVRALLLQKAGVDAELVIIKTQGDRDQVATFDKMEGKGFFTKEIEEALLNQSVDIAVHSLKDLQTRMPDGLMLGGLIERADRRDMLLARPEAVDESLTLHLKDGATVGTTSARRVAQVRFLRPDLNVVPLRGNVPTRLRKLREGEFDAILIATAGVERLELALDGLRAFRLPETVFVPAPGQGALAVQIRQGDPAAQAAIAKIADPLLADVIWLEREILRRLEGGCLLPLGTAVDHVGAYFRLRLFLGTANPREPLRVVVAGKNKEELAESAVTYLRGEAPPTNSPSDRFGIWITREPARVDEFCADCDPDRFEISAIPVFYAVPAGDPVQKARIASDMARYQWAFFTSQTTVTEFARLLSDAGVTLPAHVQIAAVGNKTARAIKMPAKAACSWNVLSVTTQSSIPISSRPFWPCPIPMSWSSPVPAP
ncbi:MAG: hydroxymethylbilane synthase [candidate division Zixibacteria bacterium]|nr:hydroxymethylbilane synthase [candidate division Zixibacteria bacterium]